MLPFLRSSYSWQFLHALFSPLAYLGLFRSKSAASNNNRYFPTSVAYPRTHASGSTLLPTLCLRLRINGFNDYSSFFLVFGAFILLWLVETWSFQIVSQRSPLAASSPSPTARHSVMAWLVSRCARTPVRCRNALLAHDAVEFNHVLPKTISLSRSCNFDPQMAFCCMLYFLPMLHRTGRHSRCPTASKLCIWRPAANHGHIRGPAAGPLFIWYPIAGANPWRLANPE